MICKKYVMLMIANIIHGQNAAKSNKKGSHGAGF